MAKTKTVSQFDAERVRQARQSGSFAIRGLTPEMLSSYLEAFDLGYLRQASLLWQKIRDRDDTIKAVAEKRELDAALLTWEILPADDSPEALKHKEALEAFYNNLTATHALDQNQRGGVSTLVRQMMHSVGHKYAVHEIVWDPSGADLTAEFRFTPLQFFENTSGRLRFLLQDFTASGVDLEDGGWMVTVGAGLMEATSIAYLYKQLPLKSWLIFCEKFGIPGLHGKTNAAYGSDEWTRFRDALANFSQDWALLTSLGGEITPLEVSASGSQPHAQLVERMDRAIARLWRGADLGTMSQAGDATGSNPQVTETDILAAADAQIISETLHHYVDAWVIKYRFATEPLAYFQLQPKTKINQELELKIDDALIRWGVPRGKKDLLAKYNRPEPDADDELVGEQSTSASPVASTDKASTPDKAEPLANEDRSRARRTRFIANSTARVAAAQTEALCPLLDRVQAITALTDDAEFETGLRRLKADLPVLERQILGHHPQLDQAFTDILATAFRSGATEAAIKRGAKTA